MNAVTQFKPKTELAATRENGVPAIVPDSIGAVQALSEIIVASGWAPRDMKQPATIAVAIMQGMEIGLKPMQALQSIAVINGRPSIWGDAAIGLVQGSGKCDYVKEWSEGDGDAMVAFCEAKRNDSGSVVTQRFSVADAKLAGLWGKAIWKQYPRRMLQMRARAFALRDAFADVLKGLSVSEEASDCQPIRDVTPASATPAPSDLAAELAAQSDVQDAEFSEPESEPDSEAYEFVMSTGVRGMLDAEAWKSRSERAMTAIVNAGDAAALETFNGFNGDILKELRPDLAKLIEGEIERLKREAVDG